MTDLQLQRLLMLFTSTFDVPCYRPEPDAPYEEQSLVSRGSKIHEDATALLKELRGGELSVVDRVHMIRRMLGADIVEARKAKES